MDKIARDKEIRKCASILFDKIDKRKGQLTKVSLDMETINRLGLSQSNLKAGVKYTVTNYYRTLGVVVLNSASAYKAAIFKLSPVEGENLRATANVYASEADWRAANEAAIDEGTKVHEELEKSIVPVKSERRKRTDFRLDLLHNYDLESILNPLSGENFFIGGSTVLYLQRYTDVAPHDLDVILYNPTVEQQRYLNAMQSMFSNLNKATDYCKANDHYVIKISRDVRGSDKKEIIDIIVYHDNAPNIGGRYSNLLIGNKNYNMQKPELIIAAKMQSARDKDYKQLAYMFAYKAKSKGL